MHSLYGRAEASLRLNMSDQKTQSGKFKELARELEADEDEARWDERLEKVAKAKPGKSE
jgi:hypothetical protein